MLHRAGLGASTLGSANNTGLVGGPQELAVGVCTSSSSYSAPFTVTQMTSSGNMAAALAAMKVSNMGAILSALFSESNLSEFKAA